MAEIPYDVARAFLAHEHAQSGAFMSTGKSVFSYALMLAHWEKDEVYVDVDLHGHYSVTTARHIHALREVLGVK